MPEYIENVLYMRDENGNMTPLGNISYAEIEQSSPNDNGVCESENVLKKISQEEFEVKCVMTKLTWDIRKYFINNWRRDHGLPLIRGSRKRWKRIQ